MKRTPLYDLLEGTPLIDGHNDLPAALRKKAGYSVGGLDVERAELHTDLARLRRGGLSAQFWSVWVPSHLPEALAAVATLEQIDAVHRLVRSYPETLGLAFTADGLERQVSTGRIASLLGIEGGHSIAESLGALRMFAQLGVRYMTLTHNDDTTWAASATGRRPGTGLNGAGVAIVAEMNRIGMMVDLSHTSESTQRDALRATSAPVIYSHSSVRAVTDHPRNVSDAMLQKLADNGGIVQITFVPEFISTACLEWELEMLAKQSELGLHRGAGTQDLSPTSPYPAAPRPGQTSESAMIQNRALLRGTVAGCETSESEFAMARWLGQNPMPSADIQDIVTHLNYAREAVGIEHLGIGGDYDGTSVMPLGLEDVSCYPALFHELRSSHWSVADMQKLAGRNMLRVMRSTEHAAAEPMWPTDKAS